MRSVNLAMLSVASLLLPAPLLAAESSLHISQNTKGLHSNFLSLVQGGAHHHKKGHHRHLRRHHKEVSHQEVATEEDASAAAAPTGYAAVSETVKDMSKAVAESQLKWETANVQCCAEHTSLGEALEALDEAIAQANGQASSAQGEILKANKKIAENENKIPDEKDALHSLHESCRNSKESMDKDLELTFGNLDGMDNMEMTSCAGKSALLQCEHPNGDSFLMLKHHTMRRSAAQWKSPAVQRLLGELSKDAEKDVARPVVFLQMEEHTDPHKCTMEANPECQQIRDRYLLMASDLEDNIDEISENLKGSENECEQSVENIDENIANANAQLKQQQTALAEATADYNEAMEGSRLKNQERESHLKEMKEHTKKCHDDKGGLLAEKAGLLKVRAELIKMKLPKKKVFIQDCKVADWTPGDCSKSCGGGMRTMTRDILVQPGLDGADCGLLKAEEKCNTQQCPINCEMGEWGGFSACSAKCGGGVLERVRDVKRHSAHGGKPCGAAQETQSCNAQSCDSNCKLRPWTVWSKCSKACDGGTMFRERSMKKAAEGQGTCPGKFSSKRLRMKACHKKACLTKKNKGKSLKCKSKRDVVLLIDGSASLRTSGWAATKKAAEAVVKSMGADVDISVLLFSGPKSRKSYFKCSGQRWPNRKTGKSLGPPDMEKDCLVKWVQHFTNDKDKAVKKIQAMKWPRGSTLTSEGLAMAETELNNGRRDAEAVVIVVTDGKPMNKRKVDMTVKRLRRKARLIWVAVSKNAPVGLIKKWASVPWKENTIFAKSFKELTSKTTTNSLVANMCPEFEVV